MSVQRRLSRVNRQELEAEFLKLDITQQVLASLLALVLLFAAYPQSLVAQEQPGPLQVPSGPQYTQQTPKNYSNWWRPSPSIPIRS